jgi:hypothetical protein
VEEPGELLLIPLGPGPSVGEGGRWQPRPEEAGRRDVVNPESRAVLALPVLPVVAVISLGFLVRAFVDAGGNQWPVWLVVVALSGGAWLYFFTGAP